MIFGCKKTRKLVIKKLANYNLGDLVLHYLRFEYAGGKPYVHRVGYITDRNVNSSGEIKYKIGPCDVLESEIIGHAEAILSDEVRALRANQKKRRKR